MKSQIIPAIVACVLLSFAATGQGFHPPAGSAIQLPTGEYSMTPGDYAGISFATGAIWSTDDLNFTRGFEIRFKLAVDLLLGYGADGVCVVFGENIRPQSVNGPGGNLGYYDSNEKRNPDFQHSFALEIDHYPNHQVANDPDDSIDHFMLARNAGYYNVIPGGEAVSIYPSGHSIANGQYNEYLIKWDCSDNTLRVYFNDSLRVTGVVDYPGIFTRPDNIKWGFTGAAALSYSNHFIKDISLKITDQCMGLDNFIIYPGKAGIYNIRGTSSSNYNIFFKIYSATGQMVYKGILNPLNYHIQQSIDLGNLAPGDYFIRFSNRKGKNTLKFPVLHY